MVHFASQNCLLTDSLFIQSRVYLLYTPNNTIILTAVNISDELSFEDIGEMAKIWQLSNISVDSDGKEKSTTDSITNLFLFTVMY